MSNLAVIPARGGSKRVPRKNVKLLGGVPMIAYSIEAALRSGVVDTVVVSTDDEGIAGIARELGATVPFLREATLADDHTPVSAVTSQMVAWLGERGELFDMVAQLLPNCPLRTAEDVRDSHDAFVAQPHAAQVSVTRYGWQNPWWALERDETGAARPLFADKLMQRSQDLPPLFCPTGAVWWATTEALLEHGTFHLQRRALFELAWEHGVDIDDEADFELAEVLLARRATTGNRA
ncbi:MAG TPA: acylneuraminate cytidylyltransferase family protein [Trueperaceae bacterium]|nr:acylneuraminate cytidylyltransferase family protein [Trueperaceae bacterium]